MDSRPYPVIRRPGRFLEELPGSPWRLVLAPLTLPAWAAYAGGSWLRNRCYDLGLAPVQRLPVPVVSIGNLTAGGTGKTPAVLAVARALRSRGRHPAILSRGYRGDGGANDEARLMDDLPVYCRADRHAAGLRAVAAGADCLVLDDGFQHRRLHRDLDLVLVDATRPGSAQLPLGWWREAAGGLARADAFWLSRADLVPTGTRERLLASLGRWGRPVLCDRHRPGRLLPLRGGDPIEAAALAGRTVLLASGIGNPAAFEATGARLGWTIRAAWRFPDHHAFTTADAQDLAAAAAGAVLVITAKDAVKLATLLPIGCDCRILEVSDLLDEAGRSELDQLLARITGPPRPPESPPA